MTTFSLPSSFWSGFVREYWDQKPTVIRQPFDGPFATTAEVFRGLLAASEKYCRADKDVPLEFYVDPAFQVIGLESRKYVPTPADDSLNGYVQRVTHMCDGRGFALILNGDFHVYDPELWLRQREFLHGLMTQIPVPLISSGVFLGNYQSTPAFGIHRDDKNIFQFVIEGRKKMHLWPGHYFSDADWRRDGDFREFLADAITLDGQAGDILCWPSSYWHVGESVGGLSMALVIACGPQIAPDHEVWNQLSSSMSARSGAAAPPARYSIDLKRPQRAAARLPTPVRNAARAALDFARRSDLEQSLQIAWLKRRTGFFFRWVPPPSPWRPLADDDVVRCDPRFPVLWMPGGTHEIVCSANGHAFTIPADPSAIELLKRLNRGRAFRVKQLIAEHAGTIRKGRTHFHAASDGIRAILEKLLSLRAITVRSPSN